MIYGAFDSYFDSVTITNSHLMLNKLVQKIPELLAAGFTWLNCGSILTAFFADEYFIFGLCPTFLEAPTPDKLLGPIAELRYDLIQPNMDLFSYLRSQICASRLSNRSLFSLDPSQCHQERQG